MKGHGIVQSVYVDGGVLDFLGRQEAGPEERGERGEVNV